MSASHAELGQRAVKTAEIALQALERITARRRRIPEPFSGVAMKRTIDLKAGSLELEIALRDAELCACPFCGEAVGVNHAVRIIVHPIPECASFGRFTAGFKSFEAAAAALESKAVFA